MEYQIIRVSSIVGAEFICKFPSLAEAKHYVQSVAALGEKIDTTYYIYCYKKKIYSHLYKYLSNCKFERF